jgi:hypothetical protein
LNLEHTVSAQSFKLLDYELEVDAEELTELGVDDASDYPQESTDLYLNFVVRVLTAV